MWKKEKTEAEAEALEVRMKEERVRAEKADKLAGEMVRKLGGE